MRASRSKSFARAGLAALVVALLAATAGQALGGAPGNASVRTVRLTASGSFQAIDAAPSANGRIIYFTAKGTGRVGVYRVASTGTATTSIATDGAFVAPRGVAVSHDGRTLYVADPQSAGGGAIFAVPATGGTPVAIEGTQGTHPRALDVLAVGGGDRLFYAGIDPNDRKPAILTVDARGGNVADVAKGAPLVAPDGVAVASSTTLYVADGHGSVFRVTAAGVKKLVGGLHTGTPAGIALTRNGKTLLVSVLVHGKARVLVIDLASGKQGLVSKVIGTNIGAGGLHRARSVNVFGWAGRLPTGKGGVYAVVA